MVRKYTKEKLEEAIKNSTNWADVCRHFNVKPSTGGQTHITKIAKRYDIDISHFTGHGWRKGKIFQHERKPLEYYLQYNGKFIINTRLRKMLNEAGLKENKCESCGLIEWMDEPIPLELDHINGDNEDRRLENLRVLCPNCHALTPTYCKKKLRCGSPTAEAVALEAIQ